LTPITRQECGVEECPFWRTGDWTECNATCGVGVRQRPYWCEVAGKKIDGRYCLADPVPRHKETCHESPCASWATGEWTPVSFHECLAEVVLVQV